MNDRSELETLLVHLEANNVDLVVDAIERIIDARVAAAMRRHLEKFHGFMPGLAHQEPDAG